MSKEVEEQAQALLFLYAYKTWQDEKKKTETTDQPARSTRRSRFLVGIGSSLVTLGQRMESRFGDTGTEAICLGSVTGK